MAKKIGRNDKCPCGSGKKYKHCCLDKDEMAQRAQRPSQPPGKPVWQPSFMPFVAAEIDDGFDVDEDSNRVIDLLDAGKLDEAEAQCRLLQERYPDMIDPIERLGMVREAQGKHAEAADLFDQAAAFASSHDGFDAEGIEWYRERAATLRARL